MSETRQLTNSLLISLFTDSLADRGYCSDMDVCMSNGVYTVSKERTANLPAGSYPYGVLLVMRSRNFVSQVYHAHHSTDDDPSVIHIRMHYSGTGVTTGWGPWTRIKGERGS